MKTIALIIAASLAFPAAASARSYCLPKNGKDRIERQGFCPSGYFASGDCCEAFRADTKQAIPRIDGKSCPSGTFASGGSCKSFR